MDERGRRLHAAAEVRALGYGGLAAVARATGLSRGTIGRGLKDLDHAPLPRGRVRRDGGGRHPLSITDPTLLEDLRQLIEPVTLGDPMLLWVSHKKLAAALRAHDQPEHGCCTRSATAAKPTARRPPACRP